MSQVYSCVNSGYSSSAQALISLLFIWKAVMVGCGVYLAIQSRVIEIDKYQERQQVAYAI